MNIFKIILNITIGEAIMLFSGRESIMAQDFDMPDVSQKKYLNETDTIDQDQVIKQIFDNYEFNGNNYTDILHKHAALPNTGKELKNLLMNEIPASYIDAFNSVVDAQGNPVFDYWDIAKFFQNDVSVKDLSRALDKAKTQDRPTMLKHIYKAKYKAWKKEHKDVSRVFINKANFKTLYSLSLIKRSKEYFKDTEKPNLLITYPSIDFNKALFSPSARKMIKDLSDAYDIYLSTLHSERDLYQAIKKVKKIELLIISGHGAKNKIILDEPDEFNAEQTYIDTRDKELKRHLARLSSDALIFLNACNTGKGGKNLENLANNIAGSAGGRKVISAMEPFGTDEIVLINKYPLDINIPNKIYTTKKH